MEQVQFFFQLSIFLKISTPSDVILPSAGYKSPEIRFIKVVFPDPDLPTIPIALPYRLISSNF